MKYLPLLILLLAAYRLPAQNARLTPQQWQADLEFLGKALPAQHPAFARDPYAQRFQGELKKLSQNLAGRSDFEIALELQTLLAGAGDAHTQLDLMLWMQRQPLVPISFGSYDDGVFVSATVRQFQAALGKKVLKINGLSVEEATRRIGRFVAVENEYSLKKDAWLWFRFPAALRQAGVGTTDTLELTLENADGQVENMRLFPPDFSKMAAMQLAQFKPTDPDLRWQPQTELFTLRWLPDDKILFVLYNRCFSREMALAAGDSSLARGLPPFQPFADSIFAILEKTPDARLLIDLRFNTGGTASDGIALADRLAALPSVNRPDRLFVATNQYTFSGAVQVAAYFGEKTRATLLGEPPAQRPNHFGEVRNITLPNSGLTVLSSTRFLRSLPGDPATLTIDKPVPMRFQHFREGRDPVLDYVKTVKK